MGRLSNPDRIRVRRTFDNGFKMVYNQSENYPMMVGAWQTPFDSRS
jgi:hypothetical protein